jgi:hypothetical protein
MDNTMAHKKTKPNERFTYIMLDLRDEPDLRAMAEAIYEDDHRLHPDWPLTMIGCIKALIRAEFERIGLRLNRRTN